MKNSHIKTIKMYISRTLANPIDNEIIIELYYQIGKIIGINQISVKDLKILEIELKQEYGIMIGFTKRNFIFMTEFYNTFSKKEIGSLKQLTWFQIIKQMKHKNQDKIEYKKKQTENYILEEILKLQKNMRYEMQITCYNETGGNKYGNST